MPLMLSCLYAIIDFRRFLPFVICHYDTPLDATTQANIPCFRCRLRYFFAYATPAFHATRLRWRRYAVFFRRLIIRVQPKHGMRHNTVIVA